MVKAHAISSFPDYEEVSTASSKDDALNPTGRVFSDIRIKKGLSRSRKPYLFGTLNCRPLSSQFSKEELNKHIFIHICTQKGWEAQNNFKECLGG